MEQNHPCDKCIVDAVCKKICGSYIKYFEEHPDKAPSPTDSITSTTQLRKKREISFIVRVIQIRIQNTFAQKIKVADYKRRL